MAATDYSKWNAFSDDSDEEDSPPSSSTSSSSSSSSTKPKAKKPAATTTTAAVSARQASLLKARARKFEGDQVLEAVTARRSVGARFSEACSLYDGALAALAEVDGGTGTGSTPPGSDLTAEEREELFEV